jgi:hypothetical protein
MLTYYVVGRFICCAIKHIASRMHRLMNIYSVQWKIFVKGPEMTFLNFSYNPSFIYQFIIHPVQRVQNNVCRSTARR